MYTSVLIAHDRQTTVMRNSVVAVVPTVAFSLAAILLFGLIGAAVASIVAAGLLFVLNYRSVMRYAPTLRVATMWTRSPPNPS
jgi:O-antigen/teichoic acid export membrane protein